MTSRQWPERVAKLYWRNARMQEKDRQAKQHAAASLVERQALGLPSCGRKPTARFPSLPANNRGGGFQPSRAELKSRITLPKLGERP
jgi:hypothetical protein